MTFCVGLCPGFEGHRSIGRDVSFYVLGLDFSRYLVVEAHGEECLVYGRI